MATIAVSFVATLNTDANFFVAALYDSSGTLLEFIAPAKAGSLPRYITPFQVTFATSVPANSVNRVILWENTVNTGPGGVARCSGDVKASVNSATLRDDLYLTADISAGLVSGTGKYIDPTNSLAGWDYSLEAFGTGTLQEGLGNDYTLDSNNNWTLINGMLVDPGQKFIIHFQPQINSAPPPPASGISSGVIITADTAMDATYLNKAIYIQSATSKIVNTLPPLSSVSDYDRIILYSNGGSHINAVTNCAGSDKILHRFLVSKIILGQCEKLELFKANGIWNVDNDLPGVDMVGDIFETYNPAAPNTRPLIGQTLNRDQYPRLWAYVSTLGSSLVSLAVWNATGTLNGQAYFTGKGFFNVGNGTTTFGLPDLTVYKFKRVSLGGGGDPAGEFNNGVVGQFTDDVTLPLGDSFTGPAGGGWSGIPGRGQNSPTNKTFAQTFNAAVQNTPNSIGLISGIRI